MAENIFEITKQRMADVQKAESASQQAVGIRKADSPTPCADYAREQRIKERRRLLDRLVPDRICPECKRHVIGSRRWVVIEDYAHCRSCHFGRRKPKRFCIAGMDVVIARGSKTQTEFAAELRISVSSLKRIEGLNVAKVNRKLYRILASRIIKA